MTRDLTPILDRFPGGGRFERRSLVGRGSSGLVYRVYDREMEADVALKTLDARDPEKIYRLKQEFRSLAGLRHRNLVELYELIVTDEDCFFTMEFIDGVDFVTYVAGGMAGEPRGSRVARFFPAARQLVVGLAALHAAGKLHRDVKPPNVLVDRSGRVVLLDFGFATAFGRSALANDRSDGAAGSLAYMAPEILWGQEATRASDWFSVGVTLYEALTDHRPFDAPIAVIGSREPPQARPIGGVVPRAVEGAILALLDRDPSARPDPEQLLAVLDASSSVRPAGPRSPLAESLFVGRDLESAALQAALERTGTAKEPAVVAVVGPSGIGKSELVRRFVAEAEQRCAAVVLRTRCHPNESVPYNAFDGLVDGLSRYLTTLPEATVDALLPRHVNALVQVFPVLARVPTLSAAGQGESGDVQEVRRRGFAALRELFARLADRQRVVVWIDDVQWSDEDSALVARDLLRSPDAPALLFIVSYRAEDRMAAARFLPVDAKPLEIELGPLSVSDAESLARALCPGRTIDLDAVAREAGGSPFLVDQVVRHLSSGSGDPSGATPLADMLNARLDGLTSTARILLEIVAVAGRPVERNIAFEAALAPPAVRAALIHLQEARLLRSTPLESGTVVEVYHDRIREHVVDTLPHDALREHHRSLAGAMVREESPDAQALYRHFLGAGESGPASKWAATAAERADRALAFIEAAQLYAAALGLISSEDPNRADLLEKRATALVNAGRGAEAAPVFLEAASHLEGIEHLDLHRRAAEQFMLTGHLAEGVESMQALLRGVGLRYPRSTAGAAVGTAIRLLSAAVRPIVADRGAAVSPLESVRLEAARSAGKGFAMVDPFRALYFAAVALGLALRSREPYRLARELAGVGATLVPAGGPPARWAAGLIERARKMAEDLQDPYLLGFTSIVMAQKSIVAGRWREMLDLCDSGVTMLREQCKGVSWEVSIGSGAAERALEELGDMRELTRRVEEALQRAEDVDDVYRAVSALENIALGRLAQDRIGEARLAIAKARARCATGGFQMQHFYMFRVESYCDLAEGLAAEALARVEGMWRPLHRSNLLRHAILRTDAHLLRARTKLARAESTMEGRAELLKDVLSDAAVLDAQARPDTIAHANVLRAATAALNGDRDGADRMLRAAAEQFDNAGMKLCCGLTRLRLFERTADNGRVYSELCADLQALGVVNPERLARAYAPGFG